MSNYDTEQIIIFQPYMAGILKRIQTERALVCVRLDKKPDTYNSIILDVDPGLAQFSLDELNPHSGHDKLRVGSALHIDARLKGVRVMFSTELAEIDDSNDIALYRLPLPASMIYRQRRRHHRARPLGSEIPWPLGLGALHPPPKRQG